MQADLIRILKGAPVPKVSSLVNSDSFAMKNFCFQEGTNCYEKFKRYVTNEVISFQNEEFWSLQALKKEKRKEGEKGSGDKRQTSCQEVPVAPLEPFLIPAGQSLTLTPANLGHSCVSRRS